MYIISIWNNVMITIIIIIIENNYKAIEVLSMFLWCFWTGTKLGPTNCVLEHEDPSLKPFMQLELKPLAPSSLKWCPTEPFSPRGAVDEDIHIINIPDNSSLR